MAHDFASMRALRPGYDPAPEGQEENYPQKQGAFFGKIKDWKPIEGEEFRPPSSQEEIDRIYNEKLNALRTGYERREGELPYPPATGIERLLPGFWSSGYGPEERHRGHAAAAERDPQIKEMRREVGDLERWYAQVSAEFDKGNIPFFVNDERMSTSGEARPESPEALPTVNREHGGVAGLAASDLVSPSLQSPFLPIRVEGRDGTYDPDETARITAQNVLYGFAGNKEETGGHGGTVIGDLVNTIVERFGPEEAGLIIRAAEKAAAEQETPPTVNREHGGIAGLAARGRGGDSMLVHMAPEEVAGLASLAPDGVTINPDTGLPEMFNLRDFLPMIATVGAGIMTGMSGGTLSPLMAAMISGGVTAATTEGDIGEKLGRGVLAGIGSWGMGKLASTLGSAGAEATAEAARLAKGEALPGLPSSAPYPGGTGEDLFTQTGMPRHATLPEFRHHNPVTGKFFEKAGLTNEAYERMTREVSKQLRLKSSGPRFEPTWGVPDAPTGQWVRPPVPAVAGATPAPPTQVRLWDPNQIEGMTQRVINPMIGRNLAGHQAGVAYQGAGLGDRLGYIRRGLGQVDLGSWAEAAPGKIPVGDLVAPGMAAMTGIGGLLPTPEYDPPLGRRTYEDEGPYFPDVREQRRPLPGYRAGIDEPFRYFAAGGTRGKTVYAQDGYSGYGFDDPGLTEPTGPTGVSAAAAADAAAEAAAAASTVSGGYGVSMEGIPSLAGRPGFASRSFADRAVPAFVSALASAAVGGLPGLLTQYGFSALSKRGPDPGLSTFTDMALDAAEKRGWGSGFPDVKGHTKGEVPVDPYNQEHFDRGIFDPTELPSLAAADVGAQEGTRGNVLGDVAAARIMPERGYRAGIGPQRQYYAQGGTEGMIVEENTDVETAAEIPSGVAATTGIMQGAPPEAQDDVEGRLRQRQVEEPQNPRERAIYDRAVLALQNELEPEVAQRAIDEFLELFGPDALHMLQEMVRGEREGGGTVETVSGETTVEEGGIQGPDVIAGKIVDPVTGEETANLRVGENEYIEPAASLVRRAQVAGLPPTPENGAMIRGEEERMLRQAVG